jgi:SulP family sulfate permease
MNKLATALRECLRAGYGAADLRADLMAGAVVGIVALPLSMALAIASGAPPQNGLYTAIVAAPIIALLGGSRVQVSGPTAAFVVILAPITARFGLGGLLLAGAMAGVLLLIMGIAGMGRIIEFVPYPVTTGFTSGIAVVIATLQVKDFLGLSVAQMPEHYLQKLAALVRALPTARLVDFGIGAFTLAVLIVWPRLVRVVPAPLVALAAGAVLAYGLGRWLPGADAATINTRFSYVSSGLQVPGIPRQLPTLLAPWRLAGPDGGHLALSFGLLYDLLPSAFAIAMLGAIESLLSAVVADGMTGHRHEPDGELIAQGIGNIVAPLFGGIAATGAIARTATGIRSGARSPFASAFHAMVVLSAVLALAPLLGYLPMASLAALLLVVAWNMSEYRHFIRLLRIAPRPDVLVLLCCFLLTVVFDMTVSVTAGIVLASLLFMRRMAEVSGVTLIGAGRHPALDAPLPRNVVVYDVAGPLFFGAAEKAMRELRTVERRTISVIVFDVEDVPAIDATGLVALESLVRDLNGAGIKVIFAGMQEQPLRVLARAGWRNRKGRLRIFRSVSRGLETARRTAAEAEAQPENGERSG